jgi:hypothetical protein
LTDRFQALFNDEALFRPIKSMAGGAKYYPITLSLRSGEAHTQENKKCTGSSIEPLRDRFVRSQSVAKS